MFNLSIDANVTMTTLFLHGRHVPVFRDVARDTIDWQTASQGHSVDLVKAWMNHQEMVYLKKKLFE